MDEEELRNGAGSPGESARFITNLYLNKIKQGDNTLEAKTHLIKERYSIYSRLGHQISDDDIDYTIINYTCESLPELIFFFKTYESLNDENAALYFKARNLIFNIIIEESNRLLPENEKVYFDKSEIENITMLTFSFVITQKS